jgi:hypothetical protein
MEFDELQWRVNEAVNNFRQADEYLLTNDACERALVHRFAVWLERFFPEWDVDCEYNLEYFNDIEDVRKKKANMNMRRLDGRPIDLDEPVDVSVFPDIIIHHRGTGSNLLAVEVKRSEVEDEIRFDYVKLVSYQNDQRLNYQYGLFLRLIPDKDLGFIDTHRSKWLLRESEPIPFIN